MNGGRTLPDFDAILSFQGHADEIPSHSADTHTGSESVTGTATGITPIIIGNLEYHDLSFGGASVAVSNKASPSSDITLSKSTPVVSFETNQSRLDSSDTPVPYFKKNGPKYDSSLASFENVYSDYYNSVFKKFTEESFISLLGSKIHLELTSRNIVQMKFLCRDLIPGSEYDDVSKGVQLFQYLQIAQKLSFDNVYFLCELLHYIRRRDLLKHLVFDLYKYDEFLHKTPSQFSKYNRLLHEICEEMCQKDLKTIKFYLNNTFNKSTEDKILTPQTLFLKLEHKNLLSKSNLELLKKLMGRDVLQNNVLYNKICEFEGTGIPGNPLPLNKWRERNEERDRIPVMAQTNVPINPMRHLHTGVIDLPEPYQTFQSEELSELPRYKMDAKPRGFCVIINNEKFENDYKTELKDRIGSEHDAKNLEYAFSLLKFRVEKYQNLTAELMMELMIKYAMCIKHNNYDCFVCCILTHGKQNQIYGVDGRSLEISQVTSLFRASTCATLAGKPKLFFIQACQGKSRQTASMQPDIETDNIHETESDTIPNEADFLVALATVPGYVSYRSRTHGSWFINALTDNLKKLHKKYDLLSIMIKVNEEVSMKTAQYEKDLFKQVPLPTPTLRKQIYFNM